MADNPEMEELEEDNEEKVSSPEERKAIIQDYSAKCRKLLKLVDAPQAMNINKALGLLNNPQLLTMDEDEAVKHLEAAMGLVQTAILEKGSEAFTKHFAPKKPEEEISLDEAQATMNEMLEIFKPNS